MKKAEVVPWWRVMGDWRFETFIVHISWYSQAAVPSEGTRSRHGRDEEPAPKGDEVGSERRKARGGRLDGPGRLFGRPEAANQTARAG